MIRKTRNYGIDVVRIICAITIFYFHCLTNYGCNFGLLRLFFRVGALCMTGFFMLSGFIISKGNAFNDLNIQDIKLFYKKRIGSIFPMYWVLLIIYLLFLNKETLAQNIITFPIEVVGIQMLYSGLFHFSHNGGTWFITCFVFCYLCAPFFIYFCKGINKKNRLIIVIIFSAILLYSPLMTYYMKIDSIYSNPFFRFMEFSIGSIIAIETDDAGKLLSKMKHSLFFFISCIGLVFLSSMGVYLDIAPWHYSLYDWVAIPCFSIMLVSSDCINISNPLVGKFVATLSKSSYNFFLVSFVTFAFIDKMLYDTHIILIATIVNIMLTIVASFIIERSIRIIMKCYRRNKHGEAS